MSEEQTTKPSCVMVSAFAGWNDACQAATNVIRHLIDTYDSQQVGKICCAGFYDYQTSRPMLCTMNGRRNIVWPETSLYRITIDESHSILVEMGPEPNYRWLEFCHRSLRFAEDADVKDVICLGAMFADCPHTRPLPIDVTTGGYNTVCTGEDDYTGPIGIPTVLDQVANDHGYNTTSMWVSIPQYLNGEECAQATLRLLDRLSDMLGVELKEGDLPRKAAQWKAQASLLTRCNDDLAEYVRHLEIEVDTRENAKFTEASGNDIAQEAEAFLRDMDGGR
ncbi:PAC2 family protein [Bifidobacterium vespertilionis]|nr:PAC2 family protein [Bifidobacterium vespertilionis]